MRMFLTALVCAFFISNVYSLEHPDYGELKRPRSAQAYLWKTVSSDSSYYPTAHADSHAAVCSLIVADWLENLKASYPDRIFYGWHSPPSCSGSPSEHVNATLAIVSQSGSYTYFSFKAIFQHDKITELETCPPQTDPDFTNPIFYEGQKWCYKPAPKNCPVGYHPKSVSHMLGDKNKCHPRDCPDSGFQSEIGATPGSGDQPFTSAGVFCNQGCAYTVNSLGDVYSPTTAMATSTGTHCAPYIDANKKLADIDKQDSCTTETNSDGIAVISCDDGASTPPPDESEIDPDSTVNNDSSKVDETTPTKADKQNCADGDTLCNLQNIESEVKNTSIDQIELAKKLHNKQVDVATKNTDKLVESDRAIVSVLANTQNQEIYQHQELIAKLDAIIAAQSGGSGVSDGGGSDGDGSGGGGSDGDGSGGGDGDGDCTGTPEDCTGVGSGNESLPTETIDLNEYTTKYQNLFSDETLPDKICKTLTSGQEICIDLTNIIAVIRAIGALLVLTAWIHCGNIITRSL